MPIEEQALRDWRTEYDKVPPVLQSLSFRSPSLRRTAAEVCSLLKSDGLKFEEALRQQDAGQIDFRCC